MFVIMVFELDILIKFFNQNFQFGIFE